jgi:hypothetical protein
MKNVPASISPRIASMRGALVALPFAAIIAGSLAGPVSADPGDITDTLSNCTGPAGTPATFTAEKESPSGGALHIVGTTQVFNLQGEIDLVTGATVLAPPAGLANSGRMVTCETLSAHSGHLVLLLGKITPAS